MRFFILASTLLFIQCACWTPGGAVEFRQLTSSAAIDRHPSWTPDGQYIVFESNRNGSFDIFRIPATGGAVEQLTSGGQDEGFPEVSPDGNQIAFSNLSTLLGEPVGNIFTTSMSGSGTWVQISTSNHILDHDWHPAWSRDGGTIYFSRRDGSNFDEWSIMQAPAIGGPTTVFYSAARAQNRPIPAWDGIRIAFESTEAGGALNIYETTVSNPASRVQLTFESVNTGAMGYSPDGQKMVYSSRKGTGWFDLYLLNLQDLTSTQLTNDAASSNYDPNNADAVYSPDGTRIAFTSRRNTGNDNIWILELEPAVTQEIEIDVNPARCPNVFHRLRGLLRVAIVGSAAFDPALVDPASIRLEGSIIPRGWNSLDLTSGGPACDCPSRGPDGYTDLILEFDDFDLSSTLTSGATSEITLDITGTLLDGTPVHGSDCLILTEPGNSGNLRQGAGILSVDQSDPRFPNITYAVADPGHISVSAYDCAGRKIATVVDSDQEAGQFQATWRADHVPAGVYFYKLVSDRVVDVRRFVLLH